MELTETGFEECLNSLRATGCVAWWSVEYHSGQNAYTAVAVQMAKGRYVLTRWDLEWLA